MPVKPLRAKSMRKVDPTILTDARFENLTSFMDYILNGDVFLSSKDRKECYQKNRGEILEQWLENKENFCERPYCFWQFEDLPTRKIIRFEKWWNAIDFPAQWEVSPILEKDFQFLKRLGLLLEKEEEKFLELEQEWNNQIRNVKEVGLSFTTEEELERQNQPHEILITTDTVSVPEKVEVVVCQISDDPLLKETPTVADRKVKVVKAHWKN
ncbi:MAG: hypothetical protein ABSH06_25125 [Thermodesulfobacteriota bacterium]